MKRRTRWMIYSVAALAGLTVIAEVGLRVGAGMGEAPYSIDDPQTEYRFAPSRTYHRAGNTIHINAVSMRSDELPPAKTDPAEKRILFIGDSILYGGGQIDQHDLATERIAARLRETLRVPVAVGNASAGSWGPENELAYVKKFGLFDADVIVILVSSHDATDKMPSLEKITAESAPAGGSRFAIEELLKKLAQRLNPPAGAPADPVNDQAACVAAFEELIRLGRAAGKTVIVAQHLEANEKPGHKLPGHAVLLDAATKLDVPVIQLGPAFAAAEAGGVGLYRDSIHPTAAGQQVIADALYPVLLEALTRPSAIVAPERAFTPATAPTTSR